MQHDLRVRALFIGMTSPATADNFAEHHEMLFNALGTPGDTVVEMGVKLALCDAFPDRGIFQRSDVMAIIEEFRAIVATSEEFQAGTSLECLDLAIARFAAAGKTEDLAEVVRLVKNRDGSTDAIVTASEALAALTDAAAALGNDEMDPFGDQLRKLGLDLVNPATGVFPKKSAAKVHITLADRRAAALTRRRGVRPTLRGVPLDMTPEERTTGIIQLPPPAMAVELDGIGPDPDRELTAAIDCDAIAIASDDGTIVRVVSIRNAMRLADSIVKHVRTMLLPADGYAWVDNLTDPQNSSVLVFQNAGDDPAPQADGLLEFPHPDGGLVQADVERSGEGFTATVYGFGADASGFVAGEGLPDMARAKFAAASAVRDFINQQ